MSSNTPGFTIVELIITMLIATIATIGLFSLLVGLANNSARILRISEQIHTNQSTLSTIQSDMALTQSYLATNSVPDPDSAASPIDSGVWQLQGTGSNARILILRTLATTAAEQSASRNVVYFSEGGDSCPISRMPVTNNIIYFLRDSTLYRRTLTETTPSAPYCPGQTIAQSLTCRTPNGTTCRQKDVVVATDINSFNIQYLAEPASSTPMSTVYPPVTNSDANVAVRTANAIRVEIQTASTNPEETPPLTSYRKMTKGIAHAP